MLPRSPPCGAVSFEIVHVRDATRAAAALVRSARRVLSSPEPRPTLEAFVPIVGLLKPNTYRDSVALMVLTGALSDLPGVDQASAMMATPANLDILRATGLFAEAFEGAGPNALCIAVEARDASAAAAALADAERLLAGPTASGRPGFGAADVAWGPRSLT